MVKELLDVSIFFGDHHGVSIIFIHLLRFLFFCLKFRHRNFGGCNSFGLSFSFISSDSQLTGFSRELGLQQKHEGRLHYGLGTAWTF